MAGRVKPAHDVRAFISKVYDGFCDAVIKTFLGVPAPILRSSAPGLALLELGLAEQDFLLVGRHRALADVLGQHRDAAPDGGAEFIAANQRFTFG